MFATSSAVTFHLPEINPLFERVARDRGFFSDELAVSIARSGGVRDQRCVPPDVQQVFGTAFEIEPAWHLRRQAAMQRHVDASVSKTVDLPADATVDTVRALFLDARRLGTKGITVYRYGSRADQVLTYGEGADGGSGPVSVDLAFAGGCSGYHCEF
jgi:ribonucleoside-diphosphate reductase alpha chain